MLAGYREVPGVRYALRTVVDVRSYSLNSGATIEDRLIGPSKPDSLSRVAI
jgi:hypothetical protein